MKRIRGLTVSIAHQLESVNKLRAFGKEIWESTFGCSRIIRLHSAQKTINNPNKQREKKEERKKGDVQIMFDASVRVEGVFRRDISNAELARIPFRESNEEGSRVLVHQCCIHIIPINQPIYLSLHQTQ